MEAIIFALIVIGLIVYGLERNNRRQAQPRNRLAGSSDVEDRDIRRLFADVHAKV